MPRSSTERLIVSLGDPSNLAGTIVFVASSLDEVRYYLSRRGLWTRIPGTDGDVLLSDGAFAYVFVDSPPWHADDDLNERIEDQTARYYLDIGPRGGVRINP